MSDTLSNPFPEGTTLYHATPLRTLDRVLRDGLDPAAEGVDGSTMGSRRVHLSTEPYYWLYIATHAHSGACALLEVDVSGLRWEPGDCPSEWAISAVVDPARLRVLEATGEPDCTECGVATAVPGRGLCADCDAYLHA